MSGHIHALTDIQLTTPAIVSIGMFDGVHTGHQALVDRLVSEAHATNRTSVVLTFFPHPDVVLKGVTGRYYLTSSETRAQLLLDRGVDLVITHNFDEKVSKIRAADFVGELCDHLKMSSLWVGPDFALGYKREGDVSFLREMGLTRGYTVETVDLWLNDGGQVISSTRIRDALRAGDMEHANRWLGRPYSIRGYVEGGDQRGRTIGFPTANVHVWDQKLLPANGVYACWAIVNGERHMAVTNIGIQPTFERSLMKVEAHLLDFEQNLYDQHLELEFIQRLRPEQRFDGVDALIAQIKRDVEAGRTVLMESLACEDC